VTTLRRFPDLSLRSVSRIHFCRLDRIKPDRTGISRMIIVNFPIRISTKVFGPFPPAKLLGRSSQIHLRQILQFQNPVRIFIHKAHPERIFIHKAHPQRIFIHKAHPEIYLRSSHISKSLLAIKRQNRKLVPQNSNLNLSMNLQNKARRL
jgi:hypothetical protein